MQTNHQRSQRAKKQPANFGALQHVEIFASGDARDPFVKRRRPFDLSQRQRNCSAKQRNFTRVPMRGGQAKVMNFDPVVFGAKGFLLVCAGEEAHAMSAIEISWNHGAQVSRDAAAGSVAVRRFTGNEAYMHSRFSWRYEINSM